MLGNPFSRAPSSLPSSVHDHLFDVRETQKQYGPYPPALVLVLQYTCNLPPAYPDEDPQPSQHKHYQALVHHILDTFGRAPTGQFEDSIKKNLRHIQSAYICCFERSREFQIEIASCKDRRFRNVLLEHRKRLIADLIPEQARLKEQQKRMSRRCECRAAPLDIVGEARLDLIKQMGPDDWHEVLLTWNWGYGISELEWITSQPECDRATAVHALHLSNVDEAAKHAQKYPSGSDGWDFAWRLACRLQDGFYAKAELKVVGSMRELASFQRAFGEARAVGRYPWMVSDDLFLREGRKHTPKYTNSDDRIEWFYDYWLDNLAPPLSTK